MAAITWRDTVAPKIANVLQFGANQVDKGLGGLSGQFANAANKMDTDQLNNALNQIQQLNQVGDAQGALDSGFIEGLGLTSPDMIMKAREALQNQVTGNQSTLTASQNFDDTQLQRGERDTVGQYQKALADGNLNEADTLLNSLSSNTQGRLAGSLSTARKEEDQRNFMNNAFTEMQRIPALNATAEQLRKDMPQYAEDIVVENGQLRPKDGGALSQPMFDKILKDRYPNATTSAPTQSQMALNLLQKGASQNISPQAVLSLQGLLGNVVGADPVIGKENTHADVQNRTSQALNEINLEEILNMPSDDTLTPLQGMNKEDVYAEFKPLTENASGFWNRGKGDFEQFTKTADTEVMKGWKDSNGNKREYDPRVIQLALKATSTVRRAENQGNLGDTGITGLFTGDDLVSDEFKTLLDTFQMKYNVNGALNESKTEAKRQAARNKIALEGANKNRITYGG